MYTISEMVQAFHLTTRTIRYYEELGLLKPQRTENGNRLYTKKHYAQLKLVLRGKRFGFSLDEIKEMVLLFDNDRTGEKQLERTVEYGSIKLGEVNQRLQELNEIKAEIENLIVDFTGKLDSIRSEKG
jgi:DNA-binding transcriptional MerR regulator